MKALHNLYKQKYLVIEKAGKSKTVVITKKIAYTNKIKEISNTSKFQQIYIEGDKQLNFLLKSEKKVINLMKRLENKGKISEKNTI